MARDERALLAGRKKQPVAFRADVVGIARSDPIFLAVADPGVSQSPPWGWYAWTQGTEWTTHRGTVGHNWARFFFLGGGRGGLNRRRKV